MCKSYASASFLFWLLAHAILMNGAGGAAEGVVGEEFDADGLALRAAVRCYVLGQSCNSDDLPAAARGTDATNVKAFYGDSIGSWRTGRVETFDELFDRMATFNEDISEWDVSLGKSFVAMFRRASSFNQDLSGWNTSSATDMGEMFDRATSFNGAVGDWNTGNVVSFLGMFNEASSFNQDLSGWNTSSATDMTAMFFNASSFNGVIGNWDTGKVTSFNFMFSRASSLNQDLSGWNTSSATDMLAMFSGATSFDGTVGDWNTGNVVSFRGMFNEAPSFNKDISGWNTSSATDMTAMFHKATAFNQNIAVWDVRNVCNLAIMFFEATSFNQDLNLWREQLTTNSLCIRAVALADMFVGSGCPVTDGPLPSGPFCQYNEFDADGLALRAAVRCYVLGQSCNSDDLPAAARGTDATNVKAFYGDSIGSWRTGRVETFQALFTGMKTFNEDISGWDVSRGKSFRAMFRSAASFNRNIADWDVRNGCDFRAMFRGAGAFDQNLNAWKEQLTTRTQCTSARRVANMFQDSGCPITAKPLPKGPFCRPVPTAGLKACLRDALNTREWCCSKPTRCRNALRNDCRQAFERVGGDRATLNRLTTRIFNRLC